VKGTETWGKTEASVPRPGKAGVSGRELKGGDLGGGVGSVQKKRETNEMRYSGLKEFRERTKKSRGGE